MHGFNNGSPGLLELCNRPNANIHIIALQEHWLHDNNLHLLNSLHPEFVGLCVSFMSEKLRTSVHYGRPYGGVGFLIRKSLFSRCKVGNKTASGRCLSIIMSLDTGLDVNIFTVYFPCYRSSFSYSNDLSECLSYLEDSASEMTYIVSGGALNSTHSLTTLRMC